MKAFLRKLLLGLLVGGVTPAWAASGIEEYHPAPNQPHAYLAPRSSAVSTLVIGFDVGSADDVTVSGITRLTQHALVEARPGPRWISAWPGEEAICSPLSPPGFSTRASRIRPMARMTRWPTRR